MLRKTRPFEDVRVGEEPPPLDVPTTTALGATLNIKPDQVVKAGTVLANWDPLTRPLITDQAHRPIGSRLQRRYRPTRAFSTFTS